VENTLQSFKKKLEELRHHIEGLQLESRLVSFAVSEKPQAEQDSLISEYLRHLSQTHSEKRRFDYNSIIVSLYGFLERFVESMIESYLKQLNRIIPEYKAIPEEIRKNYIDFSIEFMRHVENAKYEGLITKEQLISDIYSCVTDSDNYRINPYPFIHHTANFRMDVIARSFAKIGIRNLSARVIKCPVFTRYLQDKDPGSVDHAEPESALSDLNDLVSRRNEVAHGELPDQLIDNRTILDDYIPLFEVYGEALYDVVHGEILKYQSEHKGIPLGEASKVYHQGKVIGISVKNTALEVGDQIVAKPAEDILPHLAGKILELQIKGHKYDEIPANPSGVEVGIRVPFKAKENQIFFLIKKMIND